MNTKSNLLEPRLRPGVLGMLRLIFPSRAQGGSTYPTAEGPPSKRAEAIPWSRIGARAGANYTSDGRAMTPAAAGVRLHSVFQRLEREASRPHLGLCTGLALRATYG